MVSIAHSDDSVWGISGLSGLTLGPDGLLWFTDSLADAVAKVTPTGVIRYQGSGTNRPTQIAAGPDGNLWFVSGDSNAIGRVTPAGVISIFKGSGISDPHGITTGPDGNLWFTNTGSGSIGRITPGGLVSTFTGGGISRPWAITSGPDGSLWFTNLGVGSSSIGRVTPAGVVSNFTGPGIVTPVAITAGSDGNVWFTNQDSDSLGRVTPAGVVTNITGPGIRQPMGLALGSDGNLWFANYGSASIGRVTPQGVVDNFVGPGIRQAVDLTTGADGNLWFTNQSGDSIGRITTAGATASFTAPGVSMPMGITPGPDGNLWFTNYGSNSIGRVTPAGAVTTFTNAGISQPWRITAGPDGNLWFTNRGNDTVGRVTPAGLVSIFAAAGISRPEGIAAGPDGNLWFSSYQNDSIGRITTLGVVTMFTSALVSGPGAVTAGGDGNVWFVNSDMGSIGRITPQGVITEFKGEGIRSPYDIGLGSDGNVIFTNIGVDSDIGQITPTGQVSVHGFSGLRRPVALAAGPDGNIWFTTTTNRIGLLVPRWPGMPQQGSATPGPASATVTWSAPTSDGGLPINSYVVTASPGGKACIWQAGPLTCTFSNLPIGLPVTFTVTAINPAGAGPPSASSVPVTPLDGLAFHALTPARILDSRPTGPHVGPYTAPWGPAQTRDVTITAVGGAPADAAAVVVNVTVTSTTTAGYLTIWPAGGPRPLASSLNWAAGATVANLVTLKAGAGGMASVLNAVGSAHVIFDIVGYYDRVAGSGYTPLDPARILDSRPAGPQVGPYGTPWGANQTRDVSVTGAGGVAEGADAVVVNITVTGTTAAGYLSIWPAGQPRPVVSSLNWSPGQTVANAATAKVGAGGKIAIFNAVGSAHVVVDVIGSFAPGTGSRFFPRPPVRILDSRPTGPAVGPYTTPWGPASTRAVYTAAGDIPFDATAALLNVTATATTASSYLTISPAGKASLTSSLNWAAGQTVANAVPTKLGANGAVTITNATGTAHVIVDAAGWYR